jgi:hypothetical protein
MTLRGYNKRGKPNIAMQAFPEQFPGSQTKVILYEEWRANVKRPRKVSKYQSKRLKEYALLRDAWLAIHPTCEVCGDIIHNRNQRILHHQRGRVGKLLTEMRFWSSVHHNCHIWIHTHPEQARLIGVLCEKGKWGKQQ